MQDNETIVALVPADGWFAIYLQEEEPWYELGRLGAFGMVRDQYGNQSFVGIDASVNDGSPDIAQDFPNYYGTCHKDDITNEQRTLWREAGEDQAAREIAKRERQAAVRVNN